MYDYYNYPQMHMYEESDDSEESENKIKNVINNDGFQHVTYVGINELYNQPIDVLQFQEKFAFLKTSFATQHSFTTPNCTLWSLFAGYSQM